MLKLMPAIQKLLAPTLKSCARRLGLHVAVSPVRPLARAECQGSRVTSADGYGADDLMTVAATLMGFGAEDPSIAADTQKLMKAAQGDLSGFE